jgi:hypothetical protein
MYDAVNSIERTHTPYAVDYVAPAFSSREAAVIAAARTTLAGLYPLQLATIENAYQTALAAIADGPAEDAGVAVGELVGSQILAIRSTDHAFDPSTYTPKAEPGHWQPAPPLDNVMALGANWGAVTPFALASGNQFRPPAPPDMTSAAYTIAFNEVKSLGEKNSPTRTAEQTEIGVFWGYDRAGMGPPTVLYNAIARQIALQEGNTLSENARLFALHNIAQADAGIVAWDAKFVYDFWRPITAIRGADHDGNPNTVSDPDWEPLGAPGGGVVADFTPPFPAYTSGHATFGAAFFGTLANFYGTDKYQFSVESDELPGVTRHFRSFSQASAENARSRVYLGVHWNFDDLYGQSTGYEVADYAFANILEPLDPGTAIVATGADVGFAPRVRVFDATNRVLLEEFDAFAPAFRGGVRVATGDIDRDGVEDIVAAAGIGGGPHVRVFSGATGAVIRDFFAYDSRFTGGVHVATGDIDGDGFDDIITGADAGGGPHVKVFSGATGAELRSFYAYDPAFTGGVRVAIGDVNNDNALDIITSAGPGGGPHICVFSGVDNSVIRTFYAYSPNFAGGAYVTSGDFDSDGFDDIATGAGAGGGPHVRIVSGQNGTDLLSMFAYAPNFHGGVRVGVVDSDNDGRPDLLTAPGQGSAAAVRTFDGLSGQMVNQFVAYGAFTGGAFVAGFGSRGATLESAKGEAEVYIQAPEYTAEELRPLLTAAVQRWRGVGLSDQLLAQLNQVQLIVSDLAGATLGTSYGDVIVIDHNAAGHGWFFDSTPSDDAEFTLVDGRLQGNADSMAGAQFDLLTAIMHEVGHVLGLGHRGADLDNLMNATLPAAMRRTPAAQDVDTVFATL